MMARLRTWLLAASCILIGASPVLAATTSTFWWWQPGMRYSRQIYPVTRANVQAVLDLAGPTPDEALYIEQSPGNLDADSTLWVHGNTTWKGAGRGISSITRTRFNAADPANAGHVLISAPYGRHSANNAISGNAPTDSLANIHLEGFTIDGNYTAWPLVDPGFSGSSPGNFGIQLWFVDKPTIRDLEIKNTLQTGLEFDACRDGLIDGLWTEKTGQEVMLGTRNGININNNSASLVISQRWGRRFRLNNINIKNPRGAFIDYSNVSEVVASNINMHADFDSISNQGPPGQDSKYGFEIEGSIAGYVMEKFEISNVTATGLTARFITKGGTNPPLDGLKVTNVTCAFGDSSFQGAIALGGSAGGVKNIDISNATFTNINGKNVDGTCAPYCTAAGVTIFADDAGESSSDVRLDNVTLKFAHGTVYHQPSPGILIGGAASNIQVTKCAVYNAEAEGVKITADDSFAAREILVAHNYVDGAQREGFQINQSGVTGDVNGVRILHNTAKDTNKNTAGYAFRASSTGTTNVKSVRFEGNRVIRTSGTNMQGLQLVQSGSGVLDSVWVINNDLAGAATPHYNVTGTVPNIFWNDTGVRIYGPSVVGTDSLRAYRFAGLENNNYLYWKNAAGTYHPVMRLDSLNTVRIQPHTSGNVDIFGTDGSIRTRFFGSGGMSITGTGAQLQMGGFVYLIDSSNERRIVNKNAGGAISYRNAANSADITHTDDDGDSWFGGSVTAVDSMIAGGPIRPGTVAFANLGTPADGTTVYCSDCDKASVPCTTGGAGTDGTMAKREAGAWNCD